MNRFRKKSSSPATPTNSPPPTPTSPIVEYIKQELATFHPRVKDLRALAASSSAIALAIASPLCGPTDTILDEPGSSKEKAWNAAYGVARMAVEITNASSDMFLPLKAVVGALSVLIKNFDQTTANADQIAGVEERIQSLREMLAYPVSDQDDEEKAQREILRKRLAGIVAKLRPLVGQYGLLRFLNNVDYADILNGFVRDLACAVADYQTSLQQRIHENTRRIHEATNRTENTTIKIDETTNKIDESTQRIEETTKKIDERAQDIIEVADLELLQKLEPVRDAGHQAGHHDTCLRGTREPVLDGIMQWAEDPQDRHVFWLNGLAGTGKSTIAQTFSEMVVNSGILGASFFCSRDYLDRRELKNIFPTLAYQLACKYPTFRYHLVRVIKRDPTVASNSLISQLEDLIVGPLSSSNIPCIIVVDALDECIDDQPASAILSVLGRHVKQLLSLKFFITGRPEPRIRTGFRLPLLEPFTQIFLLHEVKPSSVDEDIRLYLQEKLAAISKRRSDLDLSDPWPCGGDLTALTKKSSGLYIFASTLVRFIESEHHEPNQRLQLIVTPSGSTVHEGRTGIDPLYTQILVAFSENKDTTLFASLRRVLGAVVLAFNPLSRVQVAGILGVDTSLITRSLRHLHSVLLVPNDDSKEIRVFHKSFPDFLQDHDRCTDPKFFINSPIHHGGIALDCLELLKKLKPNPCDLLDFVMNLDVVNLPELLEDKVGGAARYACGHWAMHIQSSPATNAYMAIRLISSATEFFSSNAVSWIEVMSLENRLESVIHSIYTLLDWLEVQPHYLVSDLRWVAEDHLRFTMHFFHPIQHSASHVYLSALPLSPSRTFHSRTLREKTRITEFHGRPNAWGAVLRTITASSKRFVYITTFGHRIAAACDDGTVGIYDSITGVLRQSLRPEDPVQAIRGSPDGSIFFCAHKAHSVTVWDLQTGGLIYTFVLEQSAEDITVSSTGRYLACGLFDSSVKVWEVANKIGGAAIWTVSSATHFCWLDPEERLAVSSGLVVDICDIVAGTVLHNFEIQYPAHQMVYSPKLDQLAIMACFPLESAIILINLQTGEAVVSPFIPQSLSCFTFSQTAEELVCGTETHGLQLFNVSTWCWRHIKYPGAMSYVSSLSNGTVVANFVGSGIQLLSLDIEYTLSQPVISASAVRAFDEGKIIAIRSTNHDHIELLELATMLRLLTIHTQTTFRPIKTRTISDDRTEVLDASLENRMAVYCFEERGIKLMQLRGLCGEALNWSVGIDGFPSIGRISPGGTRIVTFHDVDDTTVVFAWNAINGQLEAQLQIDPVHPLNITFDSETRFFSHHDTYRIPFAVSNFSEPEDGSHSTHDISHTLNALFNSNYSITRRESLSSVRGLQRKYHDVDDNCEWVVSGSKRVCWIPPGYIGSAQHSYCWAGCSLVMVGKDGTLRKLTFRK